MDETKTQKRDDKAGEGGVKPNAPTSPKVDDRKPTGQAGTGQSDGGGPVEKAD